MKFNQKVSMVFEELSKKESFHWNEAVELVQAMSIKVSNWLKVRGVMQFFINKGHIKRTDDIFVEEYKVIKPIDLSKYCF